MHILLAGWLMVATGSAPNGAADFAQMAASYAGWVERIESPDRTIRVAALKGWTDSFYDDDSHLCVAAYVNPDGKLAAKGIQEQCLDYVHRLHERLSDAVESCAEKGDPDEACSALRFYFGKGTRHEGNIWPLRFVCGTSNGDDFHFSFDKAFGERGKDFLALLKDPDPEVVFATAHQLYTWQHQAVLDQMTLFMDDPRPLWRSMPMAVVDPKDVADFDRVIDRAMEDPVAEIRRDAIDHLSNSERFDLVIDSLKPSFWSASRELKWSLALAANYREPADMTREVNSLRSSPDPELRCASLVYRIRHQMSVTKEEVRWGLRYATCFEDRYCFMVKSADYPELSRDLMPLLSDPDEELAYVAWKCLCSSADADMARFLLDMYLHGDGLFARTGQDFNAEQLRPSLGEALAHAGSAMDAKIRSMSVNRDQEIRILAVEAATQRTDGSLKDVLLALSKDRKPSVRSHVAYRLRAYDETTSISVLANLSLDSERQVRLEAIETLGDRGKDKELHVLRDLLKHPDAATAKAAESAIAVAVARRTPETRE